MMHFIWTIIIGFVAGLIARAVTPGDKGPQGGNIQFVLGWVFGHPGTLPRLVWGQYSVSA